MNSGPHIDKVSNLLPELSPLAPESLIVLKSGPQIQALEDGYLLSWVINRKGQRGTIYIEKEEESGH